MKEIREEGTRGIHYKTNITFGIGFYTGGVEPDYLRVWWANSRAFVPERLPRNWFLA
jgi:hypothetical protein